MPSNIPEVQQERRFGKSACPKQIWDSHKENQVEGKEAQQSASSNSSSNIAAGTSFRKVLISAYGDESNVSVVTDILPAPTANEVQVKIIYSGFSGSDINMRKGQYPMQKSAPLVPGYCLVGHVVATGPSSNKFHIGDTVCCLSIYDAEAELANLEEKYVVAVPKGVDLKSATALILDWNTAYGMVMRTASLKPGSKVFIHGISGAVGWAIAVLSSLQGAEIYGTASPKNHASIIQGLPSATPFDYANKSWIQAMKNLGGVHAVFDPLGFESWDESYSILAPKNSILIGYGGNSQNFGGEQRSMIPPVAKLFARNYLKVWEGRSTCFYYISRDDKNFIPDLNALFRLNMEGKIEIPIKQVFSMETTEDIREAHRSWGKGVGVGSLLVKIARDGE